MQNDLTIELKDGRKIGYIEYGDKKGIPVFIFHGTPGSRFMFLDDDEISNEIGIRLISLDRPGFGISTPKPNRTVLDWANDVEEVADQLGIKQFSVMGISGGGAYAAACAYSLPDRVLTANLVSSGTPFDKGKAPKTMMMANKIAFFLSKHAPWLIKASYRAQKKLLEQEPEKFKKQTKNGNKHLIEWDRQFLQTEEQLQSVMLHLGEAFRISIDECVNEPALLTKPWGFEPNQIQTQVFVWHGEADIMAPVNEIKNYSKEIPNCQEHFIKDAGHFLTEDEQVWRNILGAIKNHAGQKHIAI